MSLHFLNDVANDAGINRKIVSEYDQAIPQSQTADNPMTPRGRATQPSRGTRKLKSTSNRLFEE